MHSVQSALSGLVLLAAGLAVAGCNTSSGLVPTGTDNAASGFSDVRQGTEEEFIMDAGRRVYFASGSAQLDDVATETLDLQAAWLVNHRKWLIKLQGFADDPGSSDKNIALSKQRADAVMNYLASKGVSRERMWAKGYGTERPVRNCPETACKVQNRRVVVNLRTEFDAAAPQYKGTGAT